MNNKQNNKITSRDVDFAKWYTDIVSAAHLAAYSNTKKVVQYLNQMVMLYGSKCRKY